MLSEGSNIMAFNESMFCDLGGIEQYVTNIEFDLVQSLLYLLSSNTVRRSMFLLDY